MLVHLMSKVGRLCQPTIFMVDSVEKAYMKKVPKTDKTEPKRLKKQMSKFIKGIAAEDLMMVIGLTSEPWVAKMKVLSNKSHAFPFACLLYKTKIRFYCKSTFHSHSEKNRF
jgi:hypothetical protein